MVNSLPEEINAPVVALIPARGGSKGLKKKNLYPLFGKPLITHTIFAAQSSKYIENIWVSTDCKMIKDVAINERVSVIDRPSQFSTDTAHPRELVFHFLNSLKLLTNNKDVLVIYLQPTSPLREYNDIDCLIKAMFKNKQRAALSVTKYSKPPHKSFLINADGLLTPLFKAEYTNERRQDLPSVYYPNGAIYAFFARDFLLKGEFPSTNAMPYIMPDIKSIDVDTIDDIKLIETLKI
jgi:CMP-N-acetylneuraminic acid synthetase